MNTSRYVSNKTIHCIENEKHAVNFMSLRTKLVTSETKTSNQDYISYTEKMKELKSQLKKYGDDVVKSRITNEAITFLKNNTVLEPSKTNTNIKAWELNTPKDIRACAVADVVIAYKAAFTNLKNGSTIRHFDMNFKKKKNPNQGMSIPKTGIKNDNGCIQMMTPTFFD